MPKRTRYILRRLVVGAVFTIVAVVITAILFTKPAPVTNAKAPSTSINTTTSTTSPEPSTTTTVDPGILPQTNAFPSASDPIFIAHMQELWTAIITNQPSVADSAFFPKAAYVRLKMISNPSNDYQVRLLDQYHLDITAAHNFLGSNASKDQLVQVIVPSWNSNWVPAGTCYSNTGYYHVPETRILYMQNGQFYSIGIASLISWRGQWYVVHMGAIYPPPDTGIVNSPAAGLGSFGGPGGC